MAVKSKTDIQAEIDSLIPVGGGGNITSADLNTILTDLNDSNEPLIQEYTTVQRDALTPIEGQKIYNTTSNRLEYYSTDTWLPMSQKEIVEFDASTNPNYPEGLIGDQYIITVAGIIGGGSGKTVYVGDIVYCTVSNAGGNEATAGANWKVCYSADAADSPTRYADVTVSSASLLTSNTTPVTIIAAPGAGKFILPISIMVTMDFNSVAYATNTDLKLYIDDNGDLTIFDLSQPQDYIKVTPFSFAHDVWNNNVAVKVRTATGDPTAGNSDIKVRIFYKILTF